MTREREERRSGGMRNRVKQRAEERKQKGGGGSLNVPDGTEFFQPKKGTYKLDFLPYVVSDPKHPEGLKVGELWWRRIVFVHFAIGDEEKSYLCPKTIGKPCPICEERARMMKDANADDDIIKALKPKEREVYNIIDTESDPDKVLLWDISSYLFGRTLEEELREGPDEYADFAELIGGYTLKIRFGEKKMGKTTFLETTRIDFSEREDYDEAILDEVVDLDSILNVLPHEKLTAIFYGAEEEGAGENDKGDEKEDRESRREKRDKADEKEGRSSRSERNKEKGDEKEERTSRRDRTKDENKGDDIPPFDDESAASAQRGVEEKTGSRRTTTDEKKKETTSGDCPSGHEFGTDNDKHDECDKCKSWDACADEKDRLKSEARRSRRN